MFAETYFTVKTNFGKILCPSERTGGIMQKMHSEGILVIEGNEVYELDEECLEEKKGKKNGSS